jgi:hypothetical protein
MPTFRAHKGNYCDSVAAWWRLIGTSVRIFPAIHNPDWLFIGFRSANLTLLAECGAKAYGRSCWLGRLARR